jgi:hypothetical protein
MGNCVGTKVVAGIKIQTAALSNQGGRLVFVLQLPRQSYIELLDEFCVMILALAILKKPSYAYREAY